MIEAISFGILQGLTEFLPVSSSGHVFFLGKLSIYPTYNLPLMISIHIGTTLSIVFYFRSRIKSMLVALKKIKEISYNEERKLWKYLFIASIPAAIAGIFLERLIEEISTIRLVGTCWIINGIILVFGELISQKKREQKDINLLMSLFIGIFQATAILPGISRSGATITAARISGMEAYKAFEFSFLLGVIAIIGSFLLEVIKKPEGFTGVCFASGAIAFLSGYLALAVLAKIVKLNEMKWFGYYTILVGFLVLFKW
ncbi:MAG: undecaprenyl-diphosphate phosphatase [Candidatus Omnitrophica bacterium]|nr:undecaprenyl-diphosphate phosphatase [Candidatus Omnitrophota bacterium]